MKMASVTIAWLTASLGLADGINPACAQAGALVWTEPGLYRVRSKYV